MTGGHSEELVYAYSEDGLFLSGILVRPSAEPDRSLGVLFVHGAPISPFFLNTSRIGRALAGQGFTFLAGSTRGHDLGAILFRKEGAPEFGGTLWEQLDESPSDIGGWVAFLGDQGFARVAILGSSFGGLKAVHYLATRRDPRVVGLVLVGAPVRGEARPNMARRLDPERVALAERMVAEGRGLDLLPWQEGEYGNLAPPGTASAQTYASWARVNLDMFGSETADPAIGRVDVPLFLCYGSEEPTIATPADVEMIRRNARRAPSVETLVLAGAGHGFVGREQELADAVVDWLRRLE